MTNQEGVNKNTAHLYLAKNGLFSCFIHAELSPLYSNSSTPKDGVLANLIYSLRNQIALDACKLIDNREKIYENTIEQDQGLIRLCDSYSTSVDEFVKGAKRYRDKAGAHCDYKYLMPTADASKGVCFGYMEIYQKKTTMPCMPYLSF